MRVNLFNSKAPDGLRIPVTVNIVHDDLVETNDGDVVYLIVLSTGALGLDGERVDDVVINNVSATNVKREIGKGLALIGEQIDWGALREDNIPPRVEELSPDVDETGVSIHSNVSIKLRDHFPFSGVDESTIKLYVNDIEVTSDLRIKIDSNIAKISWVPRRIL